MNALLNFTIKTIKGGIFFLVPIALIIILANKIIQLLRPMAKHLSMIIDPGDQLKFDLAYVLTCIFLVLLCFGFGLLASLQKGKLFIKWLEDNILVVIPGYTFMKSAGQAVVGLEEVTNYPVVFVPAGGWAIGFLIEKINENSVVFVPGAPDPWTGRVLVFKSADIRETSMTQVDALRYLRHTGVGMTDLKLHNTPTGNL